MDLEKFRLKLQAQGEREEFSLAENVKLVPKFTPEKADAFFEMSEKIARQHGWPEEHWVALIQSSLTRKAQEEARRSAHMRSMVAVHGPLEQSVAVIR